MTAQGLRRELLAGDPLTGRELQALHGAALGETAAETGIRIHLGVETVRMYRKRACAKLEAANLTRAVVVALGRGMLNIDRLL